MINTVVGSYYTVCLNQGVISLFPRITSNKPSLSFHLKDIWQFYLNLTEANMEKRSEWKLEYTMTEAFDMEDIQPRSLHELALRLAQPQSKAFVKYFNHFMVSYDTNITCEGYCQTAQVCAVHFLDKESYSKCIVKAGGQNA